MLKKLNIILLTIFILSNFAYSDSDRYYYSDFTLDKNYIVYSIDLNTGERDILFDTDDQIRYPVVLSDQSKIFFKADKKMCVYDTKSQSIDTLFNLGKIDKICDIHLVDSTDKIYLSYIEEGAQLISKKYRYFEHTNLIIDKSTY